VRSVAQTVSEPRSASWIAEEAAVSENTARGHLQRLVEMNVLRSFEDGTTTYAPDPLHTRMQTLRELIDEYDHDGLLDLKADLQAEIETWQDEYGVEDPDELRALGAETETQAETTTIRTTASISPSTSAIDEQQAG
jgi:Fic family protein